MTESNVSVDELQWMTDRAGLGMSRREVEDLKPIYDMYASYALQLHDIDFGATEMVVEFHPIGPARSSPMTARDNDLHFLTIHEAGELFRAGELSPRGANPRLSGSHRGDRRRPALVHPDT